MLRSIGLTPANVLGPVELHPLTTMIRTALTAAALAIGALAAPAQADTVRGALCELSRHDDSISMEDFTCSITQLQGNVYVDSTRWAFKFPAAEQGKTYERQNTEDFKRFTREGQYTLTVFESGKKPNEPGGW